MERRSQRRRSSENSESCSAEEVVVTRQSSHDGASGTNTPTAGNQVEEHGAVAELRG